jgi:hypothetical protein
LQDEVANVKRGLAPQRIATVTPAWRLNEMKRRDWWIFGRFS